MMVGSGFTTAVTMNINIDVAQQQIETVYSKGFVDDFNKDITIHNPTNTP
jgi:hypothetical protein